MVSAEEGEQTEGVRVQRHLLNSWNDDKVHRQRRGPEEFAAALQGFQRLVQGRGTQTGTAALFLRKVKEEENHSLAQNSQD